MPLGSIAQAAKAPTLPPEAQAAVDKGVLATKQQEWLIAIQSFQDARKIAPDSPEVYYDLGLAESKIPGRELRAIAWFGAYLAAVPNAPNAAAVKKFIAELQIKSEGNLNRMIRSLQDTAANDPILKVYHYLGSVAQLWADVGNLVEAKKTADLEPDADEKIRVLNYIAEDQKVFNDRTCGGMATNSKVKVSDWLLSLDDGNQIDNCALDSGPILDLAGYLKSLPPSDDRRMVFGRLSDAIGAIVTAHRFIDQMLKQQAGEKAKSHAATAGK